MVQQEILNHLELKGDENEVLELKNTIQGIDEADENRKIHIDFNKIITMPSDLDIEDDQNAALAAIFSTRPPEIGIIVLKKEPLTLNVKEFNLYISYLKNLYNHRYTNWFHWRMMKWNSAWNAYNTKEVAGAIQFTTRPGPSLNVTLKLSRDFNKIKFIHGYVEKETGKPGKIGFKNGVVFQYGFTNNQEESEFITNLMETDNE